MPLAGQTKVGPEGLGFVRLSQNFKKETSIVVNKISKKNTKLTEQAAWTFG